MMKSGTSVNFQNTTGVLSWLGIVLISLFLPAGLNSKTPVYDFASSPIETGFQKEGSLAECHSLAIPQTTAFSTLEAEEFPREIIECIEFDDDNDRKLSSFEHTHRRAEKIQFYNQNTLFHKLANTLYILYCSLRIHLI